MDSFPIADQNSVNTFLKQYELGKNCHIKTCYTARTHHTCQFQLDCSDIGKTENFLLLAVEPASKDHLAFTASLIEHLARQDTPVTPCIKNSRNEYLSLFGHCPALLFQLPEHQSPILQNGGSCQQIGAFLGKMHANSAGFSETYGNTRSLVWLNLSANELLPQLSTGDASLLREQLDRFKNTIDSKPDLPSGPLIGSLFKDQLFFQDDSIQESRLHTSTLQAVTGFYFSCTDWFLLDVAQAVNEWCCNEQGELDKDLTKALLCAYHQERPFTPCENQYWQDVLCFSATRFWVSRLLTSLIPEQAGCPSIKHDPDEYKQKLHRRITGYCPLPR
jgi:homoserine kinase type II